MPGFVNKCTRFPGSIPGTVAYLSNGLILNMDDHASRGVSEVSDEMTAEESRPSSPGTERLSVHPQSTASHRSFDFI